MEEFESDPLKINIDGILDLHQFLPKEVFSLVEEYIFACLEKNIYMIKIIHGKGHGVLQRKVHSVLGRNPAVRDFRLDSGPSGWGATLVYLKK